MKVFWCSVEVKGKRFLCSLQEWGHFFSINLIALTKLQNGRQVHMPNSETTYSETVSHCWTDNKHFFAASSMEPKKRKIGNCAEETMKEAVNLVREGLSLRKVAAAKNIPFQHWLGM